MSSPRFVSRRHFLVWSTLAASGLPLLAGCGDKNKNGAATGGGSTAGSTMPGVLRYVITEEPTTLDPHLCFSARTMEMLLNTYEALVTYDENNMIVPVLAEALPTVSADGKTYTFKLRKGVTFHDGTPLTAAIVRENALRILSKELASPRATLTLDDLVGAKEVMAGTSKALPGMQVVDDTTFRFVLTAPRAYFVDKLTSFLMVSPKAIASAAKNEQGVGEIDKTTAIGTGLFRISEYIHGSKVTQVPFDKYWGDKPKLTRIDRPIVIDAKTSRNLYESGSVDIFLENVADYEADKDTRKNELVDVPQAGVFYVTLGQKGFKPFQDKRVRQALSHAINREVISESALVGLYPPANGFLVPGLMGSTPKETVPDALKYDPERAKKLLADAGYTAAKPLTFTLLYSEGSVSAPKVTQVLKEQWGAIGVVVTLQESEWGTLLKRMQHNEFDAMYSGWVASPDPHGTLWNLLSKDSINNYSGYASPEFEKLIAAADGELDPKKRGALYEKAVALALDEAPILPVSFGTETRLVRPYVKNLRFSLGGMLPHRTTEVI